MVPSVTAQGFRACLVAHEPGVRNYNSGLIEKDGRRYVATRRFNTNNWLCDIVLGELAGAVVKPVCVLKLPRRHGREWHEDGRLFWFNGQIHLAYTEGRYWGGHSSIQQLAILGDDWSVERVVTIGYGQNTIKNEKNWQFFVHDGVLYFSYTLSPHVVVSLDTDYNVCDVRSTEYALPADMRGGTPPVRVGDDFFTFPHFHVPHETRSRRYGFVALKFEARPPFAVTGVTAPLVLGSEEDPILPNLAYPHWLPIVVFPCGALLNDGLWTVIAGINDSYDALFTIPHARVCC